MRILYVFLFGSLIGCGQNFPANPAQFMAKKFDDKNKGEKQIPKDLIENPKSEGQDANSKMRLGIAAENEGDSYSARSFYEEAAVHFEATGKAAEANYASGLAAAMEGQHAEAIGKYAMAISDFEQSGNKELETRANLRLGHSLILLGRTREAEQKLQRGFALLYVSNLENSPEQIIAINNLAFIWTMQGKAEKAGVYLEYARKVSESDPAFPAEARVAVLLSLAHLKFMNLQYDSSLLDYQTALKITERYPKLNYSTTISRNIQMVKKAIWLREPWF